MQLAKILLFVVAVLCAALVAHKISKESEDGGGPLAFMGWLTFMATLAALVGTS